MEEPKKEQWLKYNMPNLDMVVNQELLVDILYITI
jgi:hypothetical protein